MGAGHHTKKISIADVTFSQDSIFGKIQIPGVIAGILGVGAAFALGQENYQF